MVGWENEWILAWEMKEVYMWKMGMGVVYFEGWMCRKRMSGGMRGVSLVENWF